MEDGLIEWQGTLRKTFEKYFHPEVIDKDSPEIFKTLGSGRMPDLFQFSTPISQAMIKKVKPSTLIEATAISSIIRLMTDDGGEQPSDTFIRFKNNINEWYKEMDSFGLNEEEVKVFEKHLKHINGVSDSQESIMLITMDEKVANFDLKTATKLRKLISKKRKDEALAFKDTLYEWVEKAGNRKNVADYAWHQIKRMLLYSFSVPHSLAYTLVGFEELNIFHKNPIYWQTSCLTVNSGSQELEEDDKKKDKNYGKVAKAIGEMKNYGVTIASPEINKAGFSFTPDAENNRIVYSLKGIVGLNDDVVRTIISNRPYASYEDFYTRLYETKLIQKKHMINLIKAGSFNSFDHPIEIMKQFVVKEVDVKTKLNMQNIKSVIRLGLLDTPELSSYKEIIAFRDHINKNIIRKETSPKDDILGLDEYSYEFYQQQFPEQKSIVGFNSQVELSSKEFKKEYDAKLEPLKQLINTEDFVRQFNIAQFYELWDNIAEGTVPKWEMESVSYYSKEHELDGVNKEMYDIKNYFDLSPEPEIIGYSKYQGRDIPKYKTHTIMGTVLDKSKDKHTVTILTTDGVVTCKTYAGAFAHYDRAISRVVNGKKETLEKSWFTRGNLVLLRGFRREDQFLMRTYAQKGQPKEHTVNLIKGINDDGSLLLQSDRIKI